MAIPTDRVYAQTHEWHKIEGDTLTLGLSQFAVDQLTDITFVQMKPKGTKFKAGDAIGEVESVKTTSDIYAGIGGEVIEVNPDLADDPALLNTDPFGKGWLLKAKITDRTGLDALMDAAAYTAQHGA